MKHLAAGIALALGLTGPASALTYDIDLLDFDGMGSSLTGTMQFNDTGDVAAPDTWDLVLTSPALVAGSYNPTILQSGLSGHEARYRGLAGFKALDSGLFFTPDAGILNITNGDGLSGSEIGFCIAGPGSDVLLPGAPFFFGCDGQIGVIVENGLESAAPFSDTIQLGTVAVVPLPAGLPLMLAALGGLAMVRRRG